MARNFILCALTWCLGLTVQAAPGNFFPTGGIPPHTYYVDVARNQTVSQVLNQVAFGDTIMLGPGTNHLTATLVLPAGVNLIGAGRKSSWIDCSSGVTLIVQIHSRCRVADLSIVDTNTDASFRYPILPDDSVDCTNMVCEKVGIIGKTDGFYVNNTASLVTWNLYSCDCFSAWDCFNATTANSASIINCLGCNFTADGTAGISTAVRCILPGAGTMNFTGGSLIATNGSVNSTAIQTSGLTSPGRVNVRALVLRPPHPAQLTTLCQSATVPRVRSQSRAA